MEESAAEFFPSNGDNFLVEDLLDFSNEEEDNDVVANEADGLHSFVTNATESNSTLSNVTDMNSYNSNSFSADSMACFNFTDSHFSSELSVPHDDFAELEWLSNIQEESFSIEEMQRLQIISGASAGAGQNKTATCTTGTGAIIRPGSIGNDPVLTAEMRKARSKRSRPAPCKWKNEVVSAPLLVQEKEGGSSSVKKSGGSWNNAGGEGRKCLHCATDKTPQWRTGPMGPKTLCNACGVRYKSGRLVPEYRPAASPTFVLTKHSNSHRKVMELRRQKEMMKGQHIMMLGQHQQHGHDQEVMFDECNGSDEFLIHQHVGHGYRQMM